MWIVVVAAAAADVDDCVEARLIGGADEEDGEDEDEDDDGDEDGEGEEAGGEEAAFWDVAGGAGEEGTLLDDDAEGAEPAGTLVVVPTCATVAVVAGGAGAAELDGLDEVVVVCTLPDTGELPPSTKMSFCAPSL